MLDGLVMMYPRAFSAYQDNLPGENVHGAAESCIAAGDVDKGLPPHARPAGGADPVLSPHARPAGGADQDLSVLDLRQAPIRSDPLMHVRREAPVRNDLLTPAWWQAPIRNYLHAWREAPIRNYLFVPAASADPGLPPHARPAGDADKELLPHASLAACVAPELPPHSRPADGADQELPPRVRPVVDVGPELPPQACPAGGADQELPPQASLAVCADPEPPPHRACGGSTGYAIKVSRGPAQGYMVMDVVDLRADLDLLPRKLTVPLHLPALCLDHSDDTEVVLFPDEAGCSEECEDDDGSGDEEGEKIYKIAVRIIREYRGMARREEEIVCAIMDEAVREGILEEPANVRELSGYQEYIQGTIEYLDAEGEFGQ